MPNNFNFSLTTNFTKKMEFLQMLSVADRERYRRIRGTFAEIRFVRSKTRAYIRDNKHAGNPYWRDYLPKKVGYGTDRYHYKVVNNLSFIKKIYKKIEPHVFGYVPEFMSREELVKYAKKHKIARPRGHLSKAKLAKYIRKSSYNDATKSFDISTNQKLATVLVDKILKLSGNHTTIEEGRMNKMRIFMDVFNNKMELIDEYHDEDIKYIRKLYLQWFVDRGFITRSTYDRELKNFFMKTPMYNIHGLYTFVIKKADFMANMLLSRARTTKDNIKKFNRELHDFSRKESKINSFFRRMKQSYKSNK